MNAVSKAVDTELALERAGGNADLARELYSMLQKELPEYKSKIQQYFENNEIAALIEAVHKLNGSATYCGVPTLKSAAEVFESDLKNSETARFEQGMKELLSAIEELQQTPALPL